MDLKGTDLKHELVRIIKREMIAQGVQVKVITTDPRDIKELPCIALNRVTDNESQMGFNNLYDEEYDPATEQSNPFYSGLMTENIEIRIWTENSDERDSLSFLSKGILILAKQELIKKGLGNMQLNGGRDEQDFKTFDPYFIYWYVINFTALNPMDVRPTPTTVKPIVDVNVDKYAMNKIEETESQLI